jgi:O-antigen ligase
MRIALISVFVVSCILTGTRFAVYAFAAIFLWYICVGATFWTRVAIGVAVAVMVAFANWETIGTLGATTFARLMDTSDVSRLSTLESSLRFWANLPLVEKLVGVGYGQVYPYTEWVDAGEDISKNTFSLGDSFSLVQPHNSYLWLLTEGGLLGFALFFAPIWRFLVTLAAKLKNAFRVKQFSLENLQAAAMILLANMQDSYFVLSPSAAVLFWFLIFHIRSSMEESVAGAESGLLPGSKGGLKESLAAVGRRIAVAR